MKKITKIIFIILFIAIVLMLFIKVILKTNKVVNSYLEEKEMKKCDTDIIYWGDSLTAGAGGKRNYVS